MVTSALILSYASGYRFSPQHKTIVQTGILFVNARPRVAQVYLNKKLKAEKLPFRAIHLIPGTYTVGLRKDGYYTWEKILSVQPRETTFAAELTLWRDEKPKQLGSYEKIFDLAWHNDELLALAFDSTKKNLAILKFHEKTKSTIQKIIQIQDVEDAKFIKNNNLFIIEILSSGKKQFFAFFPEKSEDNFLIPSPNSDTQQSVHIDPTRDSVIYIQSKEQILQFNIAGKKYELLANGTLLGVDGDTIWYESNEKNGKGIYTLHLATRQKKLFTNSATDIELIPIAQKEKRLLLKNKKDNTLYFVKEDPEGAMKRLPIQENGTPQAIWSSDMRRWLIATEGEIWLVDSEGNSTLIERTSQKIKSASFLGDREYILLHAGDEVKIIELDNRNGRNSWTLKTTKKSDSVQVDTSDTHIGFVSDNKVYSLLIR